MFDHLQPVPPDPILGLTTAFAQDPNPKRVNLGVGVYRDDRGRTPTLAAVRAAEARLLEEDAPKTYLPITGAAEYGAHVQRLLFADGPIVQEGRAVTAHSPGGTGGLRVVGDFVRKHRPGARIWVSTPTWANHHGVFGAAGLDIVDYPYLDAATHGLDFSGMMSALSKAPEGDIVLLHGCCHNPSGIDPSPGQWEELAGVLVDRSLVPLFDVAYQGFGAGLEEDVAGLRTVAGRSPELFVVSSFSKNFGLYNERVGAVTLVARDRTKATAAKGHLERVIRTNFSNPPRHGEAVVLTILDDETLTAAWTEELAAMRGRIAGMRQAFVEGLQGAGISRDFGFINAQNGMFSMSGLSRAQVDALRDEHSIYIVGSGRINVAGLTTETLDYVCEAMAKVLAA
ncbi:MAG: amino acid aminotransferase [Myxococcota bacterium]